MNDLTNHRSSGLGKILLWLALLLTFALLGFVTAVAVKNNPLYSDVNAHGISKYRFLEQCKELAGDGEKLTVGAMGQTLPLKALIEQGNPLQAGQTVHAALEAEPAQMIKAIEPAEAGGWNMTAPVTVGIQSKGGSIRTLGQLPMTCAYSKADKKTTATLQLPGQ